MSKDQIPKRIPNNANHISSLLMILQSIYHYIREISDSPQAQGGFVEFNKSSLGFRGHLITNFPNVMVLLISICIYYLHHLVHIFYYLFQSKRLHILCPCMYCHYLPEQCLVKKKECLPYRLNRRHRKNITLWQNYIHRGPRISTHCMLD